MDEKIREIDELLCDYLLLSERKLVMNYITNQQQTIENLKCCGNCNVDDICFVENSNHGTVCECWQPKENI